MLPKTDEKILESGNPQNPPDWDRLQPNTEGRATTVPPPEKLHFFNP
jgi:hypothetical protein